MSDEQRQRIEEKEQARITATEVDLRDRLAQSEYRARALEQQLQLLNRLQHLTIEELDLERRRRVPAGHTEELVEALRDACALVIANLSVIDRAGGAFTVERWMATIDRARGRNRINGEQVAMGQAEARRIGGKLQLGQEGKLRPGEDF